MGGAAHGQEDPGKHAGRWFEKPIEIQNNTTVNKPVNVQNNTYVNKPITIQNTRL